MKPAVGVIGLGIMGGAMAEALLAAGYKVCGYDPNAAAQRRFKKAGGKLLASAAAVARNANVVIMSLATVRALKAVTDEVAAAKSARKPIVMETSTLPIADKERTAAAFARAGMRTLGYIEGQNLIIDYRSPDGRLERLPQLAAELVRDRLKTNWGLAETGASGPTGNSYGDPAGHTCVAVVGPSGKVARTLRTGSNDRVANMREFARVAMQALADRLG